MCRLLGIVSSEPTEFRIVLKEAPRSLAALSKEHKDGWGIAIFHDDPAAVAPAWRIEKSVEAAHADARFHELAIGSRGATLVAHIRQRTVGPTSLHNTHPFQRGPWVFAHNGTIKDQSVLRAHASKERLAEVQGDTDSELLFAYLLTRLDAAGLATTPPTFDTDRVIRTAVRELRAVKDLGAYNFLLSNGTTTYAHRFGRSLFLLERHPGDAVRVDRESKEGVVVHTPWSPRRRAVLVASEKLTDEPWQEVSNGMLVRLDRMPEPHWRLVDLAPAA